MQNLESMNEFSFLTTANDFSINNLDNLNIQ